MHEPRNNRRLKVQLGKTGTVWNAKGGQILMVDSVASGVARGWRGFRHGGGFRGGKRGPVVPAEKGPERSGAREEGRRELI